MAPEDGKLADIHRRPIGRATIGDQLRRHARTQPGKVALVSYSADGARRATTYGELNRAVNVVANALHDRGVRRGDRVAMMARNGVPYVVAYYAALKLGAAFTGINVMFRDHEVAYQVTHAEPAVLVVAEEFVPLVDGVRDQFVSVGTFLTLGAAADGWLAWADLGTDESEPEVDVDELDVAMMVYTSGTESFPKGVVIPHRNYLISTAPAWSWGIDTTPRDTWLFVMPFHTIAGLGSMTTLTLMGATLVLPGSPDPAYCLGLVRAEKITVIAQTPTFYLALCAQPDFGPEAVSTVRRCMTYGGLVARTAVEAWAGAGSADLMWGTYWGQSELSQLGSVGWFRELADIPGGDPTFIGKPVSHLETRVVDPDGQDAEVGELWCRSPSVMLGYYKDPERTAEVMRDGWVHTGDMVRVDDDGNLYFYDRIKDVVKTGGMNVSSQEVERAVGEVDGVQRVAVVGMPDDYWSEAVTAFVVGSVDPEAVIAHCKARLAAYKVPKAVHLVETLPTDAQGKILKRELRRTTVASLTVVGEPTSERRVPVRTEIILRAATELFAEQGYHAVGMRLIAARVGIRGPSLYHHFAQKEDLLYAIALSVTKVYMDEHLPLLDGPGSPRDRLSALLRAHLEYMWEHRLEEVVGLREMHALSADRRAEINDHRRYYQRRIRDTIAAGVRAGDFDTADPRLATFALLDMLNGVNGWYRPGGPYAVEEVVERYVELIVGHLLAG